MIGKEQVKCRILDLRVGKVTNCYMFRSLADWRPEHVTICRILDLRVGKVTNCYMFRSSVSWRNCSERVFEYCMPVMVALSQQISGKLRSPPIQNTEEQWRSKALRGPGSTVTWGPPSTSPSLPFPSSSPAQPLLLPRSCPSNPARGSGERCKLPQWGLGPAPAEIEFGAF